MSVEKIPETSGQERKLYIKSSELNLIQLCCHRLQFSAQSQSLIQVSVFLVDTGLGFLVFL